MLFGSTGNITLITLVCLVKNLELATVYLKFLHALNFFWRDRYFIRDKFVKVLRYCPATRLPSLSVVQISTFSKASSAISPLQYFFFKSSSCICHSLIFNGYRQFTQNKTQAPCTISPMHRHLPSTCSLVDFCVFLLMLIASLAIWIHVLNSVQLQ